MSRRDAIRKIRSASEHFERFECREVIEILETDEMLNNADALLLLGQAYNRTSKALAGVSRSISKSRKYWLKALELGNTEAARELGDMYHSGSGVKESDSKAEYYWAIAAEDGNELAQFNLANHYYSSRHDEINKAIQLYEQLVEAAEFAGNSCTTLGRIYRRGTGIKCDNEKALLWWQKGVEFGNGNSCMDLAYMYYKGEGVEKNIDKALSLLEKARDSEWTKQSAEEIAERIRNGGSFR